VQSRIRTGSDQVSELLRFFGAVLSARESFVKR
jgi:hypothetical protein